MEESSSASLTSSARSTRVLHLVIGLAFAVAITSPVLFTTRSFGSDFTNQIWFAWLQGSHSGLVPTYFVNTPTTGIFAPWFAFYGGPLFTMIGMFDKLLGGHILVTIQIVLLATASAAYGGTYRCARLCGVSRWLSHLPAICVVTSCYYASSLYGGDLSEFIAISMIPLVIAMGATVLRDGVRYGPIALLFVSALVMTGSNNLVLLWALVFGVVGLLAALALHWRPAIAHHGVLTLGATVGVAVLINAWELAPLLAYGSHTNIAQAKRVELAPFLTTFRTIFSPVHYVPGKSTSTVFLAIPSLFLGAGLITAAVAWRTLSTAVRKGLAIAIGVSALIVLLVTTHLWTHVPGPISNLQFGSRLDSYGTLIVAAILIVAARGLESLKRWRAVFVGGLMAVVSLIALAEVADQIWVVYNGGACASRACGLVSPNTVPQTWYAPADYADASLPIVKVPAGRVMTLDPATIGSEFSGSVTAPSGFAPIATDIAADPKLITVSGVKTVGRTKLGMLVVRRETSTGPILISVRPANGFVVRTGKLLSLIGLALASLAFAVATALAMTRGRQSTRQPTLSRLKMNVVSARKEIPILEPVKLSSPGPLEPDRILMP